MLPQCVEVSRVHGILDFLAALIFCVFSVLNSFILKLAKSLSKSVGILGFLNLQLGLSHKFRLL